ncbi:MAG: Rrf2 family transcriptional regulator [Devosia indica]
MRLTQFSDYAWRLLMHVADQDGQRTTIAEAAKANDISRSHLMKVAQRLAQEGFLKPARGRKGGLMLGKPPEAITLGDVLRVTEPGFALVGCMAGEWCLFADRCQVPSALDRALEAFIEVADQQTLANALPSNKAVRADRPASVRPAARSSFAG